MRDTEPYSENYQSRPEAGEFPQSQFQIVALAADVISKADAQHPVDSVLRQQLVNQRRVAPELRTAVARLVFSFYRWLGWLNPERPLADRIDHAERLDERFSNKAAEFEDSHILTKAVPSWACEQVECSSAWVRLLQTRPKLWLRAKKGTAQALATKLGNCRLPMNESLPDTIEYRGEEDLFRTPEFHNGEFEIQDINSQAVAVICEPKPGETWWDACAGEGGKTLHLAELMENKGLIWASDRAEWRLKNLKRRTSRAKIFNYRAALWDGSEKLPTKTKFDGVLVDAPCSGVGTWQRNPHARWTTTLEDVRELAEIQKQLLYHVARSVKPGGKLVYSVCTLTRAETTEVAAAFEKEFPHFKPVSLKDPFQPEKPAQTGLWLWPQDTGGNGMFIAAWLKQEEPKKG